MARPAHPGDGAPTQPARRSPEHRGAGGLAAARASTASHGVTEQVQRSAASTATEQQADGVAASAASGPDLGVRLRAMVGPRSAWRGWSGTLAIAAVAYAMAVVVAFVLRPDGEAGAQLISDFGEVPLGVVAVVLAAAVVHLDTRPQARAAWMLIALGTACDTIGNVLYGAYDMAGEAPFPSMADAFYLAFYPLLLTGLLLLPTASRRRDLLDWRTASNVAIVIIGGGMAVLHFMLAPVIPDLGGDPMTSAILLAYPVGDLALLAALATISARRPHARDQRAITLIAAAVGLWLLGDILFAIIEAGGDSATGALTDLLYILGDVGLVLAAQASLVRVERPGELAAAPSSEAVRIGPYVMLLLGLATLVVAAAASPDETTILAVMAVCLTSLVVARQLADERERRRVDALLLAAHRAAAADAERKARRDPLTGLANRVRLDEILRQELAASAASDRPVTLAFVDLNDFKTVNDTHGHAAGDELLVAVGQRLAGSVRSSDTVVRLGGDEFAVVLPGIADEQALDVVRRAAATLDRPFAIGSTSLVADGAFGLATSRGIGPADLDALLSRADTAMYRAKRLGTGPTYFDPALDAVPEPVAATMGPAPSRASCGGRRQPPDAASTTRAAASARSSRQGGASSWTPIGRPSSVVPPRTTAAGSPVRLWTSLYVSPNQGAVLSPWRMAACGIAGQAMTSTRASASQRRKAARIASARSRRAVSSAAVSGVAGDSQPRVSYDPMPGVPAAVISRWSQAQPSARISASQAVHASPRPGGTSRRMTAPPSASASAAASTDVTVSGVAVRSPLSVNATTRRPRTSRRSSGGIGTGATCGSSSSGPAITGSASARSSTRRAIGPSWVSGPRIPR
jgi:diguanylate cyclase (GGDEF)-like protein